MFSNLQSNLFQPLKKGKQRPTSIVFLLFSDTQETSILVIKNPDLDVNSTIFFWCNNLPEQAQMEMCDYKRINILKNRVLEI